MDALNRLRLHILQDEIRENWEGFQQYLRAVWPLCQNKVGVSLGEVTQESEGRVWVEVGGEGFRLRVIHLHPANPSLAEVLDRRFLERGSNLKESDDLGLVGDVFSPPQDDQISLSSLEDYWFNHWQGPFITADSNQNSYNPPRLRRSHRKSKRKSRCSICQKKLVDAYTEENGDSQCFDGSQNILAHIPSHKLEPRASKDDTEERSDDDVSRHSFGEDALSRCSASDEQLARANRILDHELKTCMTLFADEEVVQDIVDGPNCLNLNATEPSAFDTSGRFLPHATVAPTSAFQSRSCPCSPKLSSTQANNSEYTNSPKSRSYLGISKFSLSSSLLAIHRQASNTFKPDFLKLDLKKSDSSACTSKANSRHSSMKSEAHRTCHSFSDVGHDSSRGDGSFSSRFDCHTNSSTEELFNSSVKSSTLESQSLPVLKLSKMSLTYKGGVIISEETENDHNENIYDDFEEGACALVGTSSQLPKQSAEDEKFGKLAMLPDVIPELEISQPRCGDSHCVSNTPDSANIREGVINLGFDGTEESSDFSDQLGDVRKANYFYPPAGLTCPSAGTKSIAVDLSKAHGISIGHLSEGKEYSLSVEPSSGYVNGLGFGSGLSERSTKAASVEEPRTNSIMLEQEDKVSPSNLGPNLRELPPFSDAAHSNSLPPFLEEEEKDVMQEARELVYWWRKKSSSAQEENEFCLHETECKVKQKPLLLFLHGIGSSADVWTQQLWYFLACGYEVVAPDLLGHGLSSAPKHPKHYSFANMLEYISLVLDLFVPQGRKCVVIGHNYGSALSVALARGRPMSVGLVTLVSCGGPNPLVPYSNKENALNSCTSLFLRPFISCGCLSRELLYFARGKHFPSVASEDEASRGGGLSATPRYVVENTCRGQHWPEGDMAFHRRLTIPTLLLHGMKDASISLVEMCEMEKTIPRAFLQLIPGAGHEMMTDSAEEVCHSIHKFIKRWKSQI